MNRIIMYGVDQDTGLIVSRVGSEFAWPVLDYVAIGNGGDGFPPGDFRGPIRYNLEKMPVNNYTYPYQKAIGCKKLPVRLKNLHRVFWGFKPLKETRS